MADLPENPSFEDLADILRSGEGGRERLTALLTERPELRALTNDEGTNIVQYAGITTLPPVTTEPDVDDPNHGPNHDHPNAPPRRAPSVAQALNEYSMGGNLTVVNDSGGAPENITAISTAIRSDANSADRGDYFTLVREGDRTLVVTGNRTRGMNGRFETTGVYELQGDQLVPATNTTVQANTSYEIALDGKPYMQNDPNHPSRPTTVAVSTSVAPTPSTGSPAAPGTPIPADSSVVVVDTAGLPDALRMSGTGTNTRIAEVLAEPESSVAQREARGNRPRAFLIVPDSENPGQIQVLSGYRDGNNFVPQNATRVLVDGHGPNTYVMNNGTNNLQPIAIGTNTDGSQAITAEDFNRNFTTANPNPIDMAPRVPPAPVVEDPSPSHAGDHSTPLRRTPPLAQALREYSMGGNLTVVNDSGGAPENITAISTAIRSNSNSADQGSYFTLVQEGDRTLVVTGNRTRGMNGRFETTGVYEMQGDQLVPVTNATVQANTSYEIALDGKPYMQNDPNHPSRPVTVAVSTSVATAPSIASPATPSLARPASPSLARPASPSVAAGGTGPGAAAPGVRIPNSLQGSVSDYSTGMGTEVRTVDTNARLPGQRRISAAVQAAAPGSTSYVVAQENGRDIVIAGNVRNGQFVVSQTFNVGADNQSLVPATNTRYTPNNAIAMNGTSANLTGPVVAAGSAPASSGPAASTARQNWRATVASIREAVSDGVNPGTGAEIATALRNYANNPANNLNATNRQGMLTAAQNIENMTPDQVENMMNSRARNGQTVEQLLTSTNPRDNSVAVTSMMRQGLGGSVAQGRGQQPGGVDLSNPSQGYINALRNGNAQEAGSNLQQLAEQQMQMAQATNNRNLANTARINLEAANALQGPNGQQALEQQLARQVGNGRTVSDMLNSNNPNTQNLAGGYIANANSQQGQGYNGRVMGAMQVAARMEGRLNPNALAGNHGHNHGINGGDHHAGGPNAPAGGPGARRGGPAGGVTV